MSVYHNEIFNIKKPTVIFPAVSSFLHTETTNSVLYTSLVSLLWIITYNKRWCVTANTFKVKDNLFLYKPWRCTEVFGVLLCSLSISVVDEREWTFSGPGFFIRGKDSPGAYQSTLDELKSPTGRFGKHKVLLAQSGYDTPPFRPHLVPTVSYWLLRLCKARGVINVCLQCEICLVPKFSTTDICGSVLSSYLPLRVNIHHDRWSLK
jgi:hypothetical protein